MPFVWFETCTPLTRRDFLQPQLNITARRDTVVVSLIEMREEVSALIHVYVQMQVYVCVKRCACWSKCVNTSVRWFMYTFKCTCMHVWKVVHACRHECDCIHTRTQSILKAASKYALVASLMVMRGQVGLLIMLLLVCVCVCVHVYVCMYVCMYVCILALCIVHTRIHA